METAHLLGAIFGYSKSSATKEERLEHFNGCLEELKQSKQKEIVSFEVEMVYAPSFVENAAQSVSVSIPKLNPNGNISMLNIQYND